MSFILSEAVKNLHAFKKRFLPATNGSLPTRSFEPRPNRATLFNEIQLGEHARALALKHQLATRHPANRLITRLRENERVLVESHDLLTAAVERDSQITPAAEWLLDNFYVLEEQVRIARRHLPPSYSDELPHLAQESPEGVPRVYAIAMELTAHADGAVEVSSLNAFVSAYQATTPLTLGELWALPIMLRLALIENLRRAAVHLMSGLNDRALATVWAAKMTEAVELHPSDLVLVLADMARSAPPMSTAFVAELTRHLHAQGTHFALAQNWIETRVLERGLNIAHMVQSESQAQAADQISIGNSITSLRVLGAADWREFVEGQSLVEHTLREDPAGVYADMSPSTRDRYRHAVEAIAKHGRFTEGEVAREAVRLAEASALRDPATRQAHVGYFLVDDGKSETERHAGMRLPLRARAERLVLRFPLAVYCGGIALLSAAMLAVLGAFALPIALPPWIFGLLAFPLLLCVTQLALTLVNWMVSLLVPARALPRLDLRRGIPLEHRTIVVIPTMLSSPEDVQELIDRLELHYVANRDPNIFFALLTDLKDAPAEVMPEDAALIQQAADGIRHLNEKYRQDRAGIFLLFHRPRRWNPSEAVWMATERKRGKLEEFTALLRGGATGCFSVMEGDVAALSQIRYVITLDTDTQLPRDAARELIGAMAHPLNRPIVDVKLRRVIAGHGIMQPRVAASLPSSSRSWFARLFASDAGLDPYTRVVSDVYQDLFAEGSFIGKGIYDVDAFNLTCTNFPANTILSHDLLEGTYARSALLSDVELYEDYPSRFSSDASRRRRWIRGDWQILPWLLPRVPGAGPEQFPNPLSPLSKWKIFDNLRRSLVPAALVSLLLLGWLTSSPVLAAGAMLLVLGVIATPQVLPALTDLSRKPVDLSWALHLAAFRPAIARRAGQVVYGLVFLPYEAWLGLDAIGRTLTRMLWTRRGLLKWTTSSDAHMNARTDLAGFFRSMREAPIGAALVFGAVMLLRPENLSASAPLLALWCVSPGVAWWLSRPILPPPSQLSESQHRLLRKLARKTWRYFEVFVTEEENWLPPDNFQFEPVARIASRTSPTNIGMALLANLSAYDFGYCPSVQLLKRTQQTLATLARMDKYQGHFYNWYDTRTLQPLAPAYVSTVDSGNLAMYLLVLRQGLVEQQDAPLFSPRLFAGLRDTVRVLRDQLAHAHGAASHKMRHPLETLEIALEQEPDSCRACFTGLQEMLHSSLNVDDFQQNDPEIKWWTQALLRQIAAHQDALLELAPWVALPRAPEILWTCTGENQALRREQLRASLALLEGIPSLRQAALLDLVLIDEVLMDLGSETPETSAADWLLQLRTAVVAASDCALERLHELEEAAQLCLHHADMDFTFLYDASRYLFSIGYNVSEHRLDTGYYDLLASEARAASYVAITQGQLDQEHWFAMRRMLTISTGVPALLSWNGSMFEYLMPMLVMPSFANTLLDQTCHAIVRRQIEYGHQRGVAWGISESGYNTLDVHMNYQYRGFGVPGLGLKRGLVDDLVVAPYASVLALMVAPKAACRNIERLTAEGRLGAYGLYEAIDYTPSRLPAGVEAVPIKSFMAHHEGMSLLSLAYLLLDRPMQRRFSSDPSFKANELLLQERVPRATAPVFPHAVEASTSHAAAEKRESTLRVITDPSAAAPELHLLSNGRYHVMVNSAGGGYSRWNGLALTRWREDPTLDGWGSFCYLRDLDSGNFWSTGHQPALKPYTVYEAIFSQAKAEFRRRDFQIEAHVEISISPEDDIELRRLTLTNRSNRTRKIEITTYAEVVLASSGQDLAHPAFSNLFVNTELDEDRQAILCTRRPRSPQEQPPWMFHQMTTQAEMGAEPAFETDRMKFTGRGRTLAAPAAMEPGGRLTGSLGAVLDPIVSIRRVLRLAPHESVRVDIVSGVAATRDAALGLAGKYQDQRLADRVFELAWTHSHVELRHINATEADAQLYARLAGAVIYAGPALRSAAPVLMRNRRSQAGLWGHGISGDLPIVLVRIGDVTKLDLIRQVFQAHAYWRMKGLEVDVVIWNEDESVYRQDLHDAIFGLIASSPQATLVDRPGGVFLRRGEQMPEADRTLLLAAARVVLADDAGTFREQVERRRPVVPRPPALEAVKTSTELWKPQGHAARELSFFNGFGGFTHDGREYVTVLEPGQHTPAPWVNVIANPHFGTVVSESGGGYTWAQNSHEYRLTPWSNDPVGGGNGEAVYLRDEESGRVWSPMPQPIRGPHAYVTRHGFGYTIFEYEQNGIFTELIVYVSMTDPVKFVRLKVVNRSGRARRLSATGYWEFVLGELRCKTRMHIATDFDANTNAIFARNAYNIEFGEQVAFVTCSETNSTMTTDRLEFFGRNGTRSAPAALLRTRLSGRTGAGFDACAAIQTPFELADGHERVVIFSLGAAASEEQAREVLHRNHGVDGAQRALEEVWRYWGHTLGVVHVETPDPAVNFLANGWLTYQVLACRMWARTGFYQSGGAFGFRDQLQDAMALIHAEPALLREQILRAAARQFVEGDVQHWWHPPAGRGVRSHCSDDYLWLPYATCRYVNATGDTGVLEERVPFLEGRAVPEGEEGYYDLPQDSNTAGTLYEHCVRAIRHGLRFGSNGLPLMGSGDWNDGMNLVGAEGRGESVWLAYFLHDVLKQFGALAERREDLDFADKCRGKAEQLRQNAEAHAWDGAWYLRAFFDDGQPLGSASNDECQIDAIAQSWSVLSGAGDPDRAAIAMDNVHQRLVRREDQLIQLFDPPFDTSALEPGYIKGYGPGIRENGGQYTHAAVWTAMAFAALGDSERLWEAISLLNPILHSTSPQAALKYRVEPYVLAADVYACAPHTGRGGWTWYTGSASWMYRLLTESLLGLRLEGDTLRFTPCIPDSWTSFKIHYRYRDTFYHIQVEQGAQTLVLDGIEQPEPVLHLVDDHMTHEVVIFRKA